MGIREYDLLCAQCKSVLGLVSAGLPTKREGVYKGGGIEKVDKVSRTASFIDLRPLSPLLALLVTSAATGRSNIIPDK